MINDICFTHLAEVKLELATSSHLTQVELPGLKTLFIKTGLTLTMLMFDVEKNEVTINKKQTKKDDRVCSVAVSSVFHDISSCFYGIKPKMKTKLIRK